MSSHASPPSNLTESGITIPSDSENYDGNNEHSPSPPPSSSSSPLILYKPPTIWGLLRGAAINLLLPFINGLMLGFGELVANEAAYRLGWSGTKIFPTHRSGSDSRRVGPGVEMRADPVERRRRNGQELDMYTSLE
ncbi:TOM13-domain-containing protein [Cucurbitaria berberidis CBS 394.84]|uniref:TOM13-domain-containing protein n=1 Tax=Cucurbitaria berberidis CBS 394.84 TaxID=1168544 RepID=A0A9P4LAE2_9PLEO|nr:TOM13-domain-containing protein [Cucurbitaria berberidis CBS 394.84]KAF1847970.1 TOM13-domain-containing protein [Cucurbitaria berberidis CBS 394.84]